MGDFKLPRSLHKFETCSGDSSLIGSWQSEGSLSQSGLGANREREFAQFELRSRRQELSQFETRKA